MYRLAILLVLSTAISAAALQPAETGGSLKPGGDLPGTFLPFNATGAHKGSFHCLISDYGQEPVVMVVVHGLEMPDPLKDLLKQLDERIEKNPAARLHAFVVFLSDDLPDVLANDDRREELAKRLQDQASAMMLKNVVLTLDSAKDVEKYFLPDYWATTVRYEKFRVVAVRGILKANPKAEFDKVLGEVDRQLQGSKRK
jgi:hypothetical protein